MSFDYILCGANDSLYAGFLSFIELQFAHALKMTQFFDLLVGGKRLTTKLRLCRCLVASLLLYFHIFSIYLQLSVCKY